MADFLKTDSQTSSVFMSYIIDRFKYNLEIFPDVLLVSVGLFAILLQSPSFTALGLSLLSVNLAQPFLAGYLREIIPNTWAVSTRSTGMFPGTSFERINLGLSTTKATLPSYYTMFLGTLLGWVAPLPLFYPQELNYSPQRTIASNISTAFIILFITILLSYRWLASQETVGGLALGVGFGALFGFIVMVSIYYATQRRATNLYNFPLISTSYGSTNPIYVCASK